MPTYAETERSKTKNGGYSQAQLAKWGVAWPPSRGWKDAIASDAKPADRERALTTVRLVEAKQHDLTEEQEHRIFRACRAKLAKYTHLAAPLKASMSRDQVVEALCLLYGLQRPDGTAEDVRRFHMDVAGHDEPVMGRLERTRAWLRNAGLGDEKHCMPSDALQRWFFESEFEPTHLLGNE